MRTSSRLVVSIIASAISLCAQAYPGESIVRDQATGNYTITYRGDSSSTELSQTVFVPSTKIDPSVRSSFRLSERGIITYPYTIANGATAKQAISGIALEPIINPILGETPDPSQRPNLTRADIDAYVAAEAAALPTPIGWDGDINRDISNIFWMPKTGKLDTHSIQAGRSLSGFTFSSLDLPGMGVAQISGLYSESEIFGFPDDGPLQDSAVFDELNRLRDNDFVRRNAAVPTIVVPVPFDAAILLDCIRTHVATWPSKQLLDPALATQLDRYLVSAADAYRRNQLKAGKEHIETLREMLKREHKELDHDDDENGTHTERNDDHRATTQRILIDRLAARILDFDLKYVLKRTEREDDDHKKR